MKKNDIYVLNPYYHLRNDTRRILLFSKCQTDENSSNNWYTFIHPLQAIMLSFFTYKRKLGENIVLLSQYFHCTESEMEHYIIPFIENSDMLRTKWRGHEIVFPRNVLIKVPQNYVYLNISSEKLVCKNLDLTSRRLYEAPLSITIMLTNRCVTHCCYCYADTNTKVGIKLSTKRICELIKEAGELGLKSVNLIGGEIFLHPDWALILKKTVDCNVATEYISTKIPLMQKIIDSLKWAGYKGIIQLSLDTLNNNIMKSLLKVNDDYLESVKRGIILLDRSGLKYQVSTVVTTYNCNSKIIIELYNFLSKLKNIVVWNVVPVHDTLHPKVDDFHILKPSYKDLDKLFLELDKLSKNSAISIAVDNYTINKKYYYSKGGSKDFEGNKCSALNTQFFILPDGKVSICEQLYWHPYFIIGDVTNNNLKSVWKSERALYLYNKSYTDIRSQSKCFHCVLNRECFEYNNRCWSDIMKAYGKDNFDYPDPRCALAEEMLNNIGY